MKSINELVRYKKIAIGFITLGFFSLIFSLNQGLLPLNLFGVPTRELAYYSNITIVLSMFAAAYCYFRYDHGLHSLDLTDNDLTQPDDGPKFEASPSEYKRNKAKKARKLKARKKKRNR